MQPTVKFGLTKAGIVSTIHTVVRYGPCSLGGIGIFDPIRIQGASQIDFLIEHCHKFNPSILLLRANVSNLHLEMVQVGSILNNENPETER